MIYILIFLFSVIVSSFSQILLKKSANREHSSLVTEYINPRIIIAYMLFFTSTLMTVYAYKEVPLSMGPVLEATSYLWVTLLGKSVLGENICKKKIVGLGVIFVGIVISYAV